MTPAKDPKQLYFSIVFSFFRFSALLDVKFEFSMQKYPRGQNLSSWDPIFDNFPPSAIFQASFLFRLRRSRPSFFFDF